MEKLSILLDKIVTPDRIVNLRHIWQFQGKRVVFTNGCFDILHLGHVEYLAKARDLGHILIIGLNTDNSVRRLKGPTRPVNPEQARAAILAALSFVDAVVLFDEDTPENLIRTIRPDILVKGKDYEEKAIVGADFVRSTGGQVVTIELTPGFSTTSTIERLQS
jgi:rfaE bifunctional protein nucleotidyltransferase chain/domain